MKRCTSILVLTLVAFVAPSSAQQDTPSRASRPGEQAVAAAATRLSDQPQIFNVGGAQSVRVVPIKGLQLPWAMAFLPNGDMLVTEQHGRLRVIRGGKLDPEPIAGMPTDINIKVPHGGLMDIMLHPGYAENKYIYFSYNKTKPGSPFDDFGWSGYEKTKSGKRETAGVALVRAKYDGGKALTDVKEIFVADAWSQGSSNSVMVFGKDGKIYISVGQPTRHAIGTPEEAQDPKNHGGKILRLNDDGTAPSDNPFVGKPGYRPEIYAMGIRNALGMFVHPVTGEIWETENGPMGGDEINILKPGKNYGWPVISYGRDYAGQQIGGLSGTTSMDRKRPDMEEPFMYWVPSPSLAGIVIYLGDKFPTWKNNILIAVLGGSNLGARQIQRVVLSPQGLPQRQGIQPMLFELKQRMRDIQVGPDGFIYVTTDERDGAVLRIEPVEPASSSR